MLFKLKKDNTAILHPECYMLCPGLKKLTEKAMLYIILAYDYDSPYRLLPPEERRRMAKFQVYGSGGEDPESDKLIVSAVELFMSLQYDSRRRSIDIYETKIRMLEDDLITAANSSDINNITKSIKSLSDAAEGIQKDINRDDSMEEIEGGGKLSLLEKMQNNKKLYKLYKEKEMIPQTGK